MSEETDAADAQQTPPGSDSTVADLLSMAESAHELDRGAMILLVSFLGDALRERQDDA